MPAMNSSPRHVTPELAEEGSLVWAMAEESDDEEGTPPHADADEPEVIDIPPDPASAPPDVQPGALHRIAPGVRR